MGTRGTLKIYLNDELKVRQYNQWDSYPTGQFQTICEFFRNKNNIISLTKRLVRTRLATKEETDKWRDHLTNRTTPEHDYSFGKEDPFENFIYMSMLTDRNIGADLLYILATIPDTCRVLPDWYHVHEEEEYGDDIQNEEGNYIIRIQCNIIDKEFYSTIDDDSISFSLEGEYHECERSFIENYVPTDDEIKDWEDSADNIEKE